MSTIKHPIKQQCFTEETASARLILATGLQFQIRLFNPSGIYLVCKQT